MDLLATVPPAEKFQTRDGVQLHVRIAPAVGESRGWILWVHGGCEHGGRYDHITELLTASGWSILLPDHRGHGLSEGERTDVDRFETYLDDLMDLQQRYCPSGRADILFGHSFGGLLAVRLAESRMTPAALILSAPLLRLKLPVPWWKKVVGQLLRLVAPRTRFRTHIDPQNMTSDPGFLAKRRADPLLIRSVTVRWFFEMQRALQAAQNEAAKISCPLLALQGLKDRTVDPTAISEFLPKTSTTAPRLIQYPDRVHEVLQDTGWQEVARQIIDWLNEQLPREQSLADTNSDGTRQRTP